MTAAPAIRPARAAAATTAADAGGEQFLLFLGTPSGGGGGGASDVRTVAACPVSTPSCSSLAATLASRLVVAAGGGGGGGGFSASDSAAGGPGGASDAAGSRRSDRYSQQHPRRWRRAREDDLRRSRRQLTTASGVSPGTLGAGGSGRLNGGGGGGGGGGGSTAEAAARRRRSDPDGNNVYGAGGGGGGGGASSLPPGPAGVSGLSLLPTDTGAEPQITLTWTLPAPTAVTQAPSGITYAGATLHGTVNPNATPLSGCQFTISPKPPGGSTLSCAQQIGSGTTPVTVSAQLLGLSPSKTYTVRLTATDAQGQSTGAPITFRTLPPPPLISRLSVGVSRRHGHRHGSVKLTLSQAATLGVAFEGKKGRRWVLLKRTMTARVRKAGTVTIGFSPKGLAAGRYRLTVVATNSVGERSGPQRATFTIKR